MFLKEGKEHASASIKQLAMLSRNSAVGLAVLPVRSFVAANGFFLPIIYAPLVNQIGGLTSVKSSNILRVLIE